MPPALEENVLERLGNPSITGALENLVSNIEAVSIMSNWRMRGEFRCHLSSEGNGVTRVLKPCPGAPFR